MTKSHQLFITSDEYIFWNRGARTPAESQLAAFSYQLDWSERQFHDLAEQPLCQHHLYPAAFATQGRVYVASMGRNCGGSLSYAIILREYKDDLILVRQSTVVSGQEDRIVYDPALYVDDQFIYLLFVDDRTGHRDVFFRKLDRYSWQPLEERQLTHNTAVGTTSWVTSIVRESRGKFYIAYGESDVTGLSSGNIHLELWDEKMQMKLGDKRILGTPFVTAPSLQFYKNCLFVAYQSLQTGNWDIFLRRYDKRLSYVEGSEEQVTRSSYAQKQPWLDIIGERLIIVYDEGQYEAQRGYSSNPKDVFRAERSLAQEGCHEDY